MPSSPELPKASAAASPKAQLAARGLRAKKHFGQNFLADQRLCSAIAERCTEPPGGTVVELGAGLGALTLPLLGRAARVIAIERDRDLVPILTEEFAAFVNSGRLAILEADAKTVDLEAAFADGPRPWVLAGNLPYQITGPLLQRAVALSRRVDRVVFLVQLEVADRLSATPDGASYGALSVFTQAAFAVQRALVIKRGAFHPQPGVDSAVVVMEPHPEPISEETPLFRRLVSAAFEQRRKMLRNAWDAVAPSAQLTEAADRAGIDLRARGETLRVEDFARMTRELES